MTELIIGTSFVIKYELRVMTLAIFTGIKPVLHKTLLLHFYYVE